MSCRCLYSYSSAPLCVGIAGAGATVGRVGREVAGGGGGTMVLLMGRELELDVLELELELEVLGAFSSFSSMTRMSGPDVGLPSTGFWRLAGGWSPWLTWSSACRFGFRCQAGFVAHNSEWWARWRV